VRVGLFAKLSGLREGNLDQASTVKSLADERRLARMRELETLREVVAGTRRMISLGPGDIAAQRTLSEQKR